MSAWQRQLNILDYTLTALMRRRWKNLSLLTLYTLLIFIVASVMFFTRAMQREAEAILAGAPDLVVQRMIAGRHDPIPLAYADEIRRMRGVTTVHPRLWGYYFDRLSGANYTIQASDDPALATDAIDVGAGIGRTRHLEAGDLFSLTDADGIAQLYDVRTLFPAASDLLTVDLVLMQEREFRRFFRFPADRATDLAVTVRNPREIATVAAKIAERYPDSRPIMKTELLRTYSAIFDWRGGMMIVIVAMAILAFIIFAWDRASGLSAAERQEIGILKSVGWDTGDVLLLKFWEGTVISLLAFLLGVIAAYGHVFLLPVPLFAHALKGWAVLYPNFRLTPFVDLYQLAVLFMLTVLPYLAATIVPSWRAASGDPDAAMRS